MDFSLTMEQEILRKSVRDFAEKEIKPKARELDEKEKFSYETCRAMGELGLFGMFVSEDYGGQGLDYISYIIAVEEIARIDGSHAATVAAGNSLGIGPLYYYGSEEQKKKIPAETLQRRKALGLRAHRTQCRFRCRKYPNHRQCWTETIG